MSDWGKIRCVMGLRVPCESEGSIAVALVLMGFLLQYPLKFLDQIICRKMTHASTYSKNMSVFSITK